MKRIRVDESRHAGEHFVAPAIAETGVGLFETGFIPAINRMDVKTNPWAFGTAAAVNGGVLALIIWIGLVSAKPPFPGPVSGTSIHLKDFILVAPVLSGNSGGGGGGGSNDAMEPIVGRNPLIDRTPLAPVQTPVLLDPKLAVNAAIAAPPDVKLPDNPNLPNIGVHQSANVTLMSRGSGSPAGLGSGTGGGDGPGNGVGYGPGSDRGLGDSIYKPGVGGVTYPVPIVTPVAEFTDEARRAKYQGICMVSIIVDAHGYPQNPRVTQPLGMGLDQKAIEAVLRYRFKPAMKNGKPVPSIIAVAVNFRLY